MMAEGRSMAAWNHTSAVIATLLNVNRDPKKSKPVNPSDIHPHADAMRGQSRRNGSLPKVKLASLRNTLMGTSAAQKNGRNPRGDRPRDTRR